MLFFIPLPSFFAGRTSHDKAAGRDEDKFHPQFIGKRVCCGRGDRAAPEKKDRHAEFDEMSEKVFHDSSHYHNTAGQFNIEFDQDRCFNHFRHFEF